MLSFKLTSTSSWHVLLLRAWSYSKASRYPLVLFVLVLQHVVQRFAATRWRRILLRRAFGCRLAPVVGKITSPQNFAPGLYELGDELAPSSNGARRFVCTQRPVEQGSTGLPFAVSIIPFGRAEGFRRCTRGKAEADLHKKAESLLGIRHPGIVVHERFFLDDTSLYVVTQGVFGPNLLKWFVAQGCHCGEVRARLVASQLLSAVSHLQEARLVHRDIKLDSILVEATSGGDFNLKLCHFDVASLLPKGATSMHSPAVGTLMYAAPEVLKGVYHISTDCFSVGVVLFLLLVGAPPFATETPQAHLRDVYGRAWELAAHFAGTSAMAQQLLCELLQPKRRLRCLAHGASQQPWIRDPAYAVAAEKEIYPGFGSWQPNRSGKMGANFAANPIGDCSLRFLSICGTAPGGGPSSLSLGASVCSTILETDQEE